MKKGFLKCKSGKGMFDGEKNIVFQLNRKVVSAIVNENSVKEVVEVTILNEKGDKYLIAIPGKTFATTRKIWIPKKMIYT